MCVPEVEAPVMTSVKVVPDDSSFAAELEAADSKLVVVDFTAEWCGPCKRIAPFYDELSNKFPRAVFLKVDVDVCTETAGAHSVTAMPTFMFFKKGLPIDKMQGADNPALEAKIKEHYEAVGWDGEFQSGVKGMIELNTFVSAQGTECLNEDDEHPYSGCLHAGPEFLQSDCDEQLILALAFNQPVKIHSLRFKAPKDKGPKNVRVFMNQPTTIDFDKADGMTSTQDIALTPAQLESGELIPLKFVKFQNVQNLQLFIRDNQAGEEVTVVDQLHIIGCPIDATNMKDFKRVAGKAGESET
jgi:thioredoxin